MQFISMMLLAQGPSQDKLSISLKAQLKSDKNVTIQVVIALKDTAEFFKTHKEEIEKGLLKVSGRYDAAQVFLIIGTVEVLSGVVKDDNVTFADTHRKPIEELLVGNYDLGTNKVNTVHHYFPSVNGEGNVISIKEHRPDTNDIDLKGRYFSTPLTSNVFSPHASVMATVGAGAGNSFFQGKGPAWGAGVTSSNFSTLLPDADAAYIQYGIGVQNHSYGTAIENYYGADARAYDQTMINNDLLLHVFSAGNSGLLTPAAGTYAGLPGVANLTGSFKMAKNVITVGHIDSLGKVLLPSSRGPAYDGRLKPELVAFGEDGSSGAAALVSGIAIILQQSYKNINGSYPPSSLIKSILFNSADDVDSAGIDYRSGYGSVNAYKAIQAIMNSDHQVASVTQNDVYEYLLTIPAQTNRFKVTLNWNDPAAEANASKSLVNDLDLELLHVSSGTIWRPWVLSHFPLLDSLRLLPVRRIDTLNNTEQISMEQPVAGEYEIRVKGSRVTTASQQFSIAWQIDTMDTFKWYYPTGSDNIFPGDTNILRWESHFTATTGELEYSTDGISWNFVDDVDLKKGHFLWVAPTVTSLARFRMKIGTSIFSTDTVTISRPLQLRVGFNCPDSVHLVWSNETAADEYGLYVLGDRFMEQFQTVSDTFVTLPVAFGTHYAVAPVIDGHPGVRSPTIDYRDQGVGCYIKSFLAYNNISAAYLILELGTNYRIRSIVWQKETVNGFIDLGTIDPVAGLNYSYTDADLKTGIHRYRVKITLTTGQVIYSPVESVSYLGAMDYLIYPNPVQRNASFNLIAKEPAEIMIRLLNSVGQPVKEIATNDISVSISTHDLARGTYFLQVIRNGRQTGVAKVIVY